MPTPWGKINPLAKISKHNIQHSSEVTQNGHPVEDTANSPSTGCKIKWNIRASRNKPSFSVKQPVPNGKDHKIKIKDEDLDLLGEIIRTGRLAPPGTNLKANMGSVGVDARLTSKAFIWGLKSLRLEDIVAVSYSDESRRFTVHSYAFIKTRWVPSSFGQARRKRKDLHFLASNAEEVLQWATAFADQGCFINCIPHPLSSSKKKGSVVDSGSSPSPRIRCRPGPTMLVILNPCSGRGRARKVYKKVEPILKLAGFKVTVVETTSAHHARNLASTMDLSTCPDGIICVGGDGLVNEVLNGLLSRENIQEALQIPIGIIPAGSDNSLVWTVLGIRDPTSAAVAIVKGGLVATDVFGVEWTKTGEVHMGLTVAYYGFMSDVLELSAKYQKRFGPLRYFVAGALRLFRLPQYKCEVEYLPIASKDCKNDVILHVESNLDTKEFPGNGFERNCDIEAGCCNGVTSSPHVLPIMNNPLPSFDCVIGGQSGFGTEDSHIAALDAANESSDYVRGLDTKNKRQPAGRALSAGALVEEALAVHHTLPGATSPSPRRTRCKSRTDRKLSMDSNLGRVSRNSSGMSITGIDGVAMNGCENVANGMGMIWGNEDSSELKVNGYQESSPEEPRWVLKQGPILGVMICNHKCKTVQALPMQSLAPDAEHDDGTLDLLIVRPVGRFQLLRLIWLIQFGRHLELPFVEYTKVRQVVLKTGNNSHQGCGIDGELLMLNGPISTSILPNKCKLIGQPRPSTPLSDAKEI